MITRACRFWGVLCLTLGFAAAGCGGPDKPVKVRGVVLLDDQPLAGATVTFLPVAGTSRTANGRTDADGAFRLTTYTTNDGALPGEYIVTVSLTISERDKERDGKDFSEMDGKAKAELFMRRTPKGLSQAKKKILRSPVPDLYSDAKKSPLRQVVPAESEVKLELSRRAR